MALLLQKCTGQKNNKNFVNNNHKVNKMVFFYTRLQTLFNTICFVFFIKMHLIDPVFQQATLSTFADLTTLTN